MSECVCVSDKIHYTFAHFSISFTSTVYGRAGYGCVRWPARRDALALAATAAGHGQPHCTRAATGCRAARCGRRVAVPARICGVCVCVRLLVLVCDMVLVLLVLHVCRFLVVLLLVVMVVADGSGSHARCCRLPQAVRVVRNVGAVCAMRYQIDLLARAHTHTRVCSLFVFYLSFMCFAARAAAPIAAFYLTFKTSMRPCDGQTVMWTLFLLYEYHIHYIILRACWIIVLICFRLL